jgi:hypothetical protein
MANMCLKYHCRRHYGFSEIRRLSTGPRLVFDPRTYHFRNNIDRPLVATPGGNLSDPLCGSLVLWVADRSRAPAVITVS